jgi:hypothetical protein
MSETKPSAHRPKGSETAQIEAKEIDAEKDVQIVKVTTLGRVAEQAISAFKWSVGIIAVCIVVGLAVVYGKTAAASLGHILTVSTGDTTQTADPAGGS